VNREHLTGGRPPVTSYTQGRTADFAGAPQVDALTLNIVPDQKRAGGH